LLIEMFCKVKDDYTEYILYLKQLLNGAIAVNKKSLNIL
jgi:hypothetical protein